MKRAIIQSLLEWKHRKSRSPLILRGARQVGKTYSVEEFGKKEYLNFLKIDLEEKPELKKLFFDNDVKRILAEISVLFNQDINGEDTLLFIDEIQVCPDALRSLRYFKEIFPELHVICAGSLLDHSLNEMNMPMPVGRVEFLNMYPMNFREFLGAVKQEKLVAYIEEFDFSTSFSELIHNQISQYLRFYFFIGGMPAVVKLYAEDNKLTEVQRVQNNLLTSMQYDFAKYGTRSQQEHLQTALKYCGRFPGRKIKYSNIDKDIRSTYLKDAINKLEFSRIIYKIKHSNSATVPLAGHVKESVYKTMFLDIGFVNQLNQIEVISPEKLITANEGMLAEQFVAQELQNSQPAYLSPDLFYWSRENKNSNAEIDFIFQHKNQLYPVEVKAGKTGTLKSLQVYLYEKKLKTGIRFNMDIPNIGDFKTKVNVPGESAELDWTLISLPLYMVSELDRIIESRPLRRVN
ncbi:MAG: ATP-binding protein [Bacteroidetes bacterium]|nr:ATP-binding protein [Bacteroidota bacterium]